MWLAVLVCAPLNGTLREFVLVPALGRTIGGLISALLLSAIALAAQGHLVRRFGLRPRDAACAWIAASWLVATLAFEFGVGRTVGHRTWEELLLEYNLFAGRFWSLVVLTIVAGPWLMAWRRGPRQDTPTLQAN
jgi:hypothetical protein